MKKKNSVERLIKVMEVLRSDKGCPWDKKQTIATLKPYIIEEAFEVVEAIDKGRDELVDELGDLFLQIVFICQIAREENSFDLDDVADAISDKLIRRHPHVFGDTTVQDAEEVVVNWNKIKKDKENKKYLLDGIPTAMPAMLLSQRYADRAASVGFDWDKWEDTLPKIDEELAELKEAVKSGDKEEIFKETGDVLAAVANMSRKLGVNAEEALRACSMRFKARVDKMEDINPDFIKGKMKLDDMEALWQKAKKELRKM